MLYRADKTPIPQNVQLIDGIIRNPGYGLGTDEFRKYIERKTGYTEPNRASTTDISTICRKICGVSLSVGYNYEHTEKEHLVVEDWLNTLNLTRKWLAQSSLPKFPLTQSGSDDVELTWVTKQELARLEK